MGETRYSVGTLTYTKAGLVTLFAWLLWGDFVFTLMEQVTPSLVPLLLKQHGASLPQIAFIMGSITNVLAVIMNPIISYKSDRFRSRWGRRRPFIFVTTPFIVLFLAAIPFAPEILKAGATLPGAAFVLGHSPWPGIILVLAVLVTGYTFFNMFIATVYYYLFPDVVPEQFIGRFYGLFRVFGGIAGMLFQWFIFGKAETHMKEIFVVTALIYGVCIMLMCWRVKEGEYPMPAEDVRGPWWSGVRNYFVECFGKLRYVLIFLVYFITLSIGSAMGFAVFFYRDEVGLSLDMQGKYINTVGLLVATLASYPVGILNDRWGGGRSLVLSSLVCLVASVGAFFGIHGLWSAAFWATGFTLGRMVTLASLTKWMVEVYPRAQYGQFCSAGAAVASLGGAVVGVAAAWFIEGTKTYRSLWLWTAALSILCAVSSYVVMRMLRRSSAKESESALTDDK